MRKKVTVVGAGNVGATCAQEIARRDYADVVLVDIIPSFPQGKALDMNQAGSVLGYEPTITGSNGYEESADSEVVVITGTGFGVPDYDFVIADDNRGGGAGLALFDPGQDPFADLFKVTVTWQGDGDPLEGYVLWHHDREILVIPPGGWEDPLPAGEYTVRVTVERESGDETVVAGTYTVHPNAHGDDDSPPFPHPGNGMGLR